MERRSFSFTAAGQSRNFAGFPFKPEQMPRRQSRPTTYRVSRVQVNTRCCGSPFVKTSHMLVHRPLGSARARSERTSPAHCEGLGEWDARKLTRATRRLPDDRQQRRAALDADRRSFDRDQRIEHKGRARPRRGEATTSYERVTIRCGKTAGVMWGSERDR